MRLRITGEIVAARQVQDSMSRDPDCKIWKAQVAVKTAEVVAHHAGEDEEAQDAGLRALTDRVEITYPIHPPVGHKVRFTAGHGDGRSLPNPRGIAQRQDALVEFRRIGG